MSNTATAPKISIIPFDYLNYNGEGKHLFSFQVRKEGSDFIKVFTSKDKQRARKKAHSYKEKLLKGEIEHK